MRWIKQRQLPRNHQLIDKDIDDVIKACGLEHKVSNAGLFTPQAIAQSAYLQSQDKQQGMPAPSYHVVVFQ